MKSYEKLKHFIQNCNRVQVFLYFTSLFFYNRNFELQKTVVDLRKSFHRTVTTVAQYFRMMLHLLKSDFRDQNTYLCNRKSVFPCVGCKKNHFKEK